MAGAVDPPRQSPSLVAPLEALDSTTQATVNPARHIAIALVLVVVTMTATAFLAKFDLVPWTTLIFVGGTVGGVVNSFRRIQKLSRNLTWETDAITGQLVVIQIYVSPFVGGIFAIVLYGIFMAGFVQGSFFPAFASGEVAFESFRQFAATSMPATQMDMAKAIVWSFVAGFSEGLVPNFISKLSKDAAPRRDGGA